jgi:hypothetical protein
VTRTVYYLDSTRREVRSVEFSLPEDRDLMEGFLLLVTLGDRLVDVSVVPQVHDHADDERRAAQGA